MIVNHSLADFESGCVLVRLPPGGLQNSVLLLEGAKGVHALREQPHVHPLHTRVVVQVGLGVMEGGGRGREGGGGRESRKLYIYIYRMAIREACIEGVWEEERERGGSAVKEKGREENLQ